MVALTSEIPQEVQDTARELVDRLIKRKRVAPALRELAEQYLHAEIIRSLRRVARSTCENLTVTLLAQRSGLI